MKKSVSEPASVAPEDAKKKPRSTSSNDGVSSSGKSLSPSISSASSATTTTTAPKNTLQQQRRQFPRQKSFLQRFRDANSSSRRGGWIGADATSFRSSNSLMSQNSQDSQKSLIRAQRLKEMQSGSMRSIRSSNASVSSTATGRRSKQPSGGGMMGKVRRSAQNLLKHNKTVKFATGKRLNQTKMIEHASEWSEEEIANLFFSPDELQDIKYDAEDAAHLWEEQPDMAARSAHDSPYRGLEDKTPEGQWEAYKARRDVLNAVLDVQDEQEAAHAKRKPQQQSSCDDQDLQALADASQELTAESQSKALKKAKADEQHANEYCRDARTAFQALPRATKSLPSSRVAPKSRKAPRRPSLVHEDSPSAMPTMTTTASPNSRLSKSKQDTKTKKTTKKHNNSKTSTALQPNTDHSDSTETTDSATVASPKSPTRKSMILQGSGNSNSSTRTPSTTVVPSPKSPTSKSMAPSPKSPSRKSATKSKIAAGSSMGSIDTAGIPSSPTRISKKTAKGNTVPTSPKAFGRRMSTGTYTVSSPRQTIRNLVTKLQTVGEKDASDTKRKSSKDDDTVPPPPPPPTSPPPPSPKTERRNSSGCLSSSQSTGKNVDQRSRPQQPSSPRRTKKTVKENTSIVQASPRPVGRRMSTGIFITSSPGQPMQKSLTKAKNIAGDVPENTAPLSPGKSAGSKVAPTEVEKLTQSKAARRWSINMTQSSDIATIAAKTNTVSTPPQPVPTKRLPQAKATRRWSTTMAGQQPASPRRSGSLVAERSSIFGGSIFAGH